jgi:hypothetical protein
MKAMVTPSSFFTIFSPNLSIELLAFGLRNIFVMDVFGSLIAMTVAHTNFSGLESNTKDVYLLPAIVFSLTE